MASGKADPFHHSPPTTHHSPLTTHQAHRLAGIFMKARKPGAWRWALMAPRLGLLLTLLTGCSTGRLHIDRALLRHADPVSREADSPEAYRLSCPDLLWI